MFQAPATGPTEAAEQAAIDGFPEKERPERFSCRDDARWLMEGRTFDVTPFTDDQSAGASRLVTVVIPAFNAASTLDETLRSVRAQTYRHLEILVVDDGSSDATGAIAEAHARGDSRVSLIRQPNAGVASARNHGIRKASAEFVAFIDADDLWQPDKIARQMAVMDEGGERIGLVYTWYALIDERGNILNRDHRPLASGDIFLDICRKNLIGNGSSGLFRKRLLDAVGGFDTALRDRGAQGCEDIKIYLQVAEQAEVGLVPDHLTGYRLMPNNMSSDVLQMLRSRDIVTAEFCARRPELKRVLGEGRMNLLRWLFIRSLLSFHFPEVAFIARRMLRQDAPLAIMMLLKSPATLARGLIAPHLVALLRRLRLIPRTAPKRPFLRAAMPPSKPDSPLEETSRSS